MGVKAEIAEQLEALNDNLFHLMISIDELTDVIDHANSVNKPIPKTAEKAVDPVDFLNIGTKIAAVLNEVTKK